MKILIFAIIIVVIIFIIFTSGIFTEKSVANVYEQLKQEAEYIFEMKKNDKNKLIIAKKDDKTIVDQYSNGERVTTLVKGNTTYLILHEREEYYIYNQTNTTDSNILFDGFEEILSNDCVIISKEKIMGKKYTYQEFGNSSFFTLDSRTSTNSNAKTRFYFNNKGKLIYVKTLNGDEIELLNIQISTKVEDSLFEIPSHYAEN